MSGIVISYRREDTEGSAGRLYDRLVDRYGRELVFMDFYSIESGEDWGAKVDRTVAKSSVLLALLGPRWVSAADEYGSRRLEDKDDYVRREIRIALEHDVRVVPVLVQGARMVGSSSLPEDLAGLGQLQAVVLDSRHYDRDVERLWRLIDAAMDLGGEVPSLGPGKTAVAAFVGLAERGPIAQPMLVTRWAQYERTFGGHTEGWFLAPAVYGWFLNGGRDCWIVRVGDDAAPAPPEVLRDRTDAALLALESIEEVTIVAAPDAVGLYQTGRYDLEQLRDSQLKLICHCERMANRVALLDPPRGLTPEQIAEWRTLLEYDSWRAALYYPWVQDVVCPSGFVPPSGHVAGMWAGADVGDGVWAAPANRPLKGVLGVESVVRRDKCELLNSKGINVLLAIPGRGIVAWGARTLSDDPRFCDLATVRLMGSVTALVRRATSWAAFERSNKATWRRLAGTLEATLQTLWQQGAFVGESQSDAFFVKCDDEVNPAELAASGRIQAEFGFAPKISGSFVWMMIEQPTGDWAVYS